MRRRRSGEQPRHVFDLGMWRMLFNIIRFNLCILYIFEVKDDLSIGEYFQREGYPSRFRDDYLIVSSCSHLYFSSLFGFVGLCIVAYDGHGIGCPVPHQMYAPWTSQPKPWFDSCTLSNHCLLKITGKPSRFTNKALHAELF